MDFLEFISPKNQILKHRVAQKIARSREYHYFSTTNPSSQDYLLAEGVLTELANIIAASK